jgi:hypothetical protein
VALRDDEQDGISKIGVIASNTGFGNGGKAQLEKYASKYGITIAISEVYDANATDLSALLTKVNAAGVQAVVNWSIEPAQSIVAKNMKQLKMAQQLFQSHGFGNIKYVEAAGEAAEGIIFPCGRLIVADQLPDSNPQKKLLVKYNADYKAHVQGGREHLRRPRLRRADDPQGRDRKREEHRRRQDRRGDRGPQGLLRHGGRLQLLGDGPQRPADGLDRDGTVKNGKFTLYREIEKPERDRRACIAQLFVQYLVSGLIYGCIYAAVAIGFNIIYNATGIINFAQGEFAMLGGMIASSLAPFLPLALAVAAAVALTAVRSASPSSGPSSGESRGAACSR